MQTEVYQQIPNILKSHNQNQNASIIRSGRYKKIPTSGYMAALITSSSVISISCSSMSLRFKASKSSGSRVAPGRPSTTD